MKRIIITSILLLFGLSLLSCAHSQPLTFSPNNPTSSPTYAPSDSSPIPQSSTITTSPNQLTIAPDTTSSAIAATDNLSPAQTIEPIDEQSSQDTPLALLDSLQQQITDINNQIEIMQGNIRLLTSALEGANQYIYQLQGQTRRSSEQYNKDMAVAHTVQEELRSNLATASHNIWQVQTDIEVLKSAIAQYNNMIAELQRKVNTLETQCLVITSLQTQISDLWHRVTDLEQEAK